MSPKELQKQIGISLNVLYEGSYGIWTMAQKGVLKRAIEVTIDLVHCCWVTEHGKFYFKDRKVTWGVKRRELENG